jgi:hypothetical protein
MINGAQSDGQVTPDEFLEYYATISMNIDSDAYFELMMGNAFDVQGVSQPFAGSKSKVTTVNAREAYRADHHRNLFGTDKRTPFVKKNESDWSTTNKNSYTDCDQGLDVPTAGGGYVARTGGAAVANDPKFGFVNKQSRMTPADYRGIKKSDDEIIEMFR